MGPRALDGAEDLGSWLAGALAEQADRVLYGAELELSKGFAVVTPYVGAGFYYGEGSLDRGALGEAFETDDTRGFVYAGVTLNLLLPKITVEVEQGEALQGALNVAIGF